MNSLSPTPAPAHNGRSLLKALQEEFPVFRECLPLAIGIDKQLLVRRPDLDRKVLRIALGIHTHSLRYLKTMSKATARFDLDGNSADEVTDTHRSHASETLRDRSKKEAERRKAQREAEAAEQQRTEKLGQLVAKFGRS
jgi:ProP effector